MSKEIDTKIRRDLLGESVFRNNYYKNIQRIINELKDDLVKDDEITSETNTSEWKSERYNQLLFNDQHYKWYKIGQQKLMTKLLDKVNRLLYGNTDWIDTPFTPNERTLIHDLEKEISILKETNKDLNKIIDEYEGRSK